MVLKLAVRGERASVTAALESLADVGSIRWVESGPDDSHTFRLEANAEADIREAVSRTVVHGGFGLLSLTPLDLSLEEIFVQLVTKEDIG